MPGKEDTYHWALATVPKQETPATRGRRYHAKENNKNPTAIFWEFSREDTGTVRTNALLVRIIIGKINDLAVIDSNLSTTPLRADQPEHPGWNCVAWVKEALETIDAHEQRGQALGTAILDRKTVRDAAIDYIDKKRGEGLWGADAHKTFNMEAISTFDLLENKEAAA